MQRTIALCRHHRPISRRFKTKQTWYLQWLSHSISSSLSTLQYTAIDDCIGQASAVQFVIFSSRSTSSTSWYSLWSGWSSKAITTTIYSIQRSKKSHTRCRKYLCLTRMERKWWSKYIHCTNSAHTWDSASATCPNRRSFSSSKPMLIQAITVRMVGPSSSL